MTTCIFITEAEITLYMQNIERKHQMSCLCFWRWALLCKTVQITALKTYMESALFRYHGHLLSSQGSKPQQLNAHPSSDQLKAWSDILSSALSGSSSVFPTLSPVRVILLLPQIQLFFISKSAQQFGKFQPQASRSLSCWKRTCFPEPQFGRRDFFRHVAFRSLIFELKSELWSTRLHFKTET